MNTTIVERTMPDVVAAQNTATATQRQNRSLTQWLFNPFSVCDTSEWSAPTGLGKLAIGGLTRVTNVTEYKTPNRSKHNAYTSTANSSGYIEVERLAFNIASEVEGGFPKQVVRIKALEGLETDAVRGIEEILLGAQMTAAHIEGAADIVPVLPDMLSALRSNMKAVARTNSSQKELLLKAGREMEAAIAANIKYALDDLKRPQQDVASGKRTGFDNNAQRNFLALGKAVPDTLKFTDADNTANTNAQLAGAIDRLANLLEAPKQAEPEPELPDDFISDEMAAEMLAEIEVPTDEETVEAAQPDTSVKCSAKTSRGTECQNDALNGSDYCRIPAHQALNQ